ncbi:MAG: hypothetical protein HY303_19305 [Candidatus Wallbacteria bacterium]|nr:hypothetical protein [Candidatus Wallbacteria bacterium]
MSPTVLLDIQTNLLVGHLFALSAWKQLWNRPVEPFDRFFARAMIWSVCCFVPVAGYFYYAYPDWSLVYMFDPAGVPSWVGPCVFAGYASGMFFGYLTAAFLLSRARLAAFVGSALFAGFLNVAMFAATWDQYWRLGSVADYRAGKGVPILSDAVFMTRMNVGGALMVLGAVIVLALNWREPAAGAGKAGG